jgi:hypothetical protein
MNAKSFLQDPDLFRQQAYIGGHWCDGSVAPIREGMKVLEGASLIDIYHGYGTYVRQDAGIPLL